MDGIYYFIRNKVTKIQRIKYGTSRAPHLYFSRKKAEARIPSYDKNSEVVAVQLTEIKE